MAADNPIRDGLEQVAAHDRVLEDRDMWVADELGGKEGRGKVGLAKKTGDRRWG